MNLQGIGRAAVVGITVCLIILGCSDRHAGEALKSIISAPSRDQEIKEGEPVYFEGNATGGTPPYSYFWDFGVSLEQSSKKVPGERTFQYEGAYTVRLTVFDSKGKSDTASVGIFVRPKSEF